MQLEPSVTELQDFEFEHFKLSDYAPHPHIRAEVSV
jgi:thymidylate synthase